MAKFNGFGGGGGNMQQMLRQAQKMQADMARVQAELEELRVSESSGGGMVTATVSGSKKLIALSVKPEAVDSEETEMLEDMIVAAVNAAMEKADAIAQQKMAAVTGGMGGLF
ncbi:MAG: YbaB/EbfC family nucleoid-associated protein [Eubacteriales bacterium]|nr:YbaB/EbfC family nucleoid-associated protein [Eubacteriales bacterium]